MKIAVIGAGITGMGCAWALAKTHEVVLLEKNARPGGHSRTLDVDIDSPDQTSGKSSVPVDTGFIVFNRENYPDLTALFELLDVPIAKSCMSFGVSKNRGEFEYGTDGLSPFFGQASNFFKPGFWRMLLGILKFNRKAQSQATENQTLGELLDQMKLGEDFRARYLLPMAASIWSTPKEKILDYPSKSFLKFFENHGLLDIFNGPQWYTVDGGSREYMQRLLADYPGELRLGVDISSVKRDSEAVTIHFSDGSSEQFDKVAFACHADQTLAMMSDPDPAETAVLENFRFQTNQLVTHTDESLMPKRRQCWSSWIYLDSNEHDQGQTDSEASLTYWMNNLQPLKTEIPVFVTMNPQSPAAEECTADQWVTEHPIFDMPAVNAQQSLNDIQGLKNAYFCGAWSGYGFHEDGLRSGLNVAQMLGAELPWRAA